MSDAPRLGEMLSLEFDSSELRVTQLSELVRHLVAFIRQLESSGDADSTATWIVQSISKQSPLRIDLAPVARAEHAPNDLLRIAGLPRVVTDGVTRLMSGVDRPAAFSDPALVSLRDLARMATATQKLRLYSKGVTVELTQQLAVNVDKLLEAAYKAYGTVEGHLDVVNVHGKRQYFAVYDDLTAERIESSFSSKVSLDDVARAISRRVAIEGEISYRSNGAIISIVADKLTPFPPDDELPSIRDVLGILRA